MRKRRQLSDEELRHAVRELLKHDTEYFMMHNLKPEHQFSEQFLEKMTPLLQDMKRGAVKAAEYFMGWQYYVKQGIAAVLICFLLACAAMPEAVLAGYHKLIEVVETIYEEYTEFRYTLQEELKDSEFKPITLKYITEGLELVREKKTTSSYDIIFENINGDYIKIHQKKIINNNQITYLQDEGNMEKDMQIGDKTITLISDKDELYFAWLEGEYHITGQTNLPENELIKILGEIEFNI